MTNLRVIDELFRQHEWATLEVLGACRGLSDEQLDATAEGTYGSIRETLRHFILSERSYVTRIGGTYDGPAPERDAPVDFDTLEAIVRASARGMTERAHAVDAQAFTIRSPEDEEIDASVVIVQALDHGAEHRTHIRAILTTLGVQPPEVDGWAWGEATGRIRQPSR